MTATLERRPGEVAAMFDAVARRYDLTNDVLSGFQDRRWRRATLEALDVIPGDRVLDLAGGTGTSAAALTDAGAEVVCADFSEGMLRVAAERALPIDLVAADAAALPFADATFDAVTISFGLRNVQDPSRALAEMARVTKPGGRLVICEFSHPRGKLLGAAYRFYLRYGLPAVARAVSSDPEAYVYLTQSILAWPTQRELAGAIAAAGWRDVAHRDLTGGIVALHRARRADQ